MWKQWSRRIRQRRHLQHALSVIRNAQRRNNDLGVWVDLALDFPSRGNVKIRTVQRRSEIVGLVERVSALQPERILEIGTYRAGTLLLWSQLASQRVVSCDLEQRDHMLELYAAFPPRSSACEVIALEGDTHEPEFRIQIEQSIGGPVDFLFIDGDHSTSGVRQDYETYRSLVRQGGLIAFHDIVERQPVPTNQVHPFWAELRASLPPTSTHEWIEEPGQVGFGIGLVIV